MLGLLQLSLEGQLFSTEKEPRIKKCDLERLVNVTTTSNCSTHAPTVGNRNEKAKAVLMLRNPGVASTLWNSGDEAGWPMFDKSRSFNCEKNEGDFVFV